MSVKTNQKLTKTQYTILATMQQVADIFKNIALAFG